VEVRFGCIFSFLIFDLNEKGCAVRPWHLFRMFTIFRISSQRIARTLFWRKFI
jgi:hypothetical protein